MKNHHRHCHRRKRRNLWFATSPDVHAVIIKLTHFLLDKLHEDLHKKERELILEICGILGVTVTETSHESQ